MQIKTWYSQYLDFHGVAVDWHDSVSLIFSETREGKSNVNCIKPKKILSAKIETLKNHNNSQFSAR